MSDHKNYWDALERLKRGDSKVVPKGSSINQANVAKEAGRAPGAIKKCRKSFASLIAAIEAAGENRAIARGGEEAARVADGIDYKASYLEALNREFMLVQRLAELEKELASFKNIVAFRK